VNDARFGAVVVKISVNFLVKLTQPPFSGSGLVAQRSTISVDRCGIRGEREKAIDGPWRDDVKAEKS
jgi:hypothetical protein